MSYVNCAIFYEWLPLQALFVAYETLEFQKLNSMSIFTASSLPDKKIAMFKKKYKVVKFLDQSKWKGFADDTEMWM